MLTLRGNRGSLRKVPSHAKGKSGRQPTRAYLPRPCHEAALQGQAGPAAPPSSVHLSVTGADGATGLNTADLGSRLPLAAEWVSLPEPGAHWLTRAQTAA